MGEGSIGESHNRIPPLLRRTEPRRRHPIDASLSARNPARNEEQAPREERWISVNI